MTEQSKEDDKSSFWKATTNLDETVIQPGWQGSKAMNTRRQAATAKTGSVDLDTRQFKGLRANKNEVHQLRYPKSGPCLEQAKHLTQSFKKWKKHEGLGKLSTYSTMIRGCTHI